MAKTNQEAVEAAARAMWERRWSLPWEEVRDDCADLREAAQTALEAARPAIEKEVRERLEEWITHKFNCPARGYGDCTCGLTAAIGALEDSDEI